MTLFPATAQNIIITTPRTSVIYFKPKIHKPNNPGRPIVSSYSCPTELISQYLDQIMSPFDKSLPSYIKDTNHVLKTFRGFNFPGQNKLIFTMEITSLYTVIPNHEGLLALKYFFEQRANKQPSTETLIRWSCPRCVTQPALQESGPDINEMSALPVGSVSDESFLSMVESREVTPINASYEECDSHLSDLVQKLANRSAKDIRVGHVNVCSLRKMLANVLQI